MSTIALLMGGDSIFFTRRGIADLTNTENPWGLGEAKFESGQESFTVYFNAMGASRVEES